MSYELIETVEVGAGGAASIEFTSIPQDGTDLVLKVSLRSAAAAGDLLVYLNGDSTSGNYSRLKLNGNGSSAFSSDNTGQNFILINNGAVESGDTANTFSNSQIYFSNYTASANKSISIDQTQENNATSADQTIQASLWADTSAITGVELAISGGSNFVQYSTASLYKVTA